MSSIVQADVMSFLSGIGTGTADLFFADPPYNLGYKYSDHKDTMPEHEYLDWCIAWLNEADRILKPTGSLFVLNLPTHAIELAAHLKTRMHFQHWITWAAVSRASNKPIMPAHYALLWFTKSTTFIANETRYKHQRCRTCGELIADYGGKKHLAHSYGPQISDVWTDIGRAKHSQRGKHPCKLPDKFVRRVLELATDPGYLVVDPFVGTGTTAYVAARMQRQYMAADNSAAYIEMARHRLAEPFNLPLPLLEAA